MALIDSWRAHHFGISVPSLDDAIAWYGRVLGFQLEKRLFIAPIPAHVAFLKRGAFRVEVFEVDGAAPLPAERRVPNLDLKTHGNKHLCIEVPSVRQAVAGLRADGVEIAFEVEVRGEPAAFIRDCAGNLLELVEPFPEDRAP